MDGALESRQPETLRAYAEAQAAAPYLGEHPVVFVVMTTCLVCALVASVGLFFFRGWAVRLYVGATVASYGVMPFTEFWAFSGISLASVSLGTLMSGATLGWILIGHGPSVFAMRANAPSEAAPSADRAARSERTRASVAIALLAAVIVADAAGIASSVAQRGLLARALAGTPPGAVEAVAHDRRHAAIRSMQVFAFVAASAGWLLWQHRAYRNLQALGSGVTRYQPGLATLWWFVPILNLVRPFQVVKELWVRKASGNALASVEARRGPILVVAWWAAWLAGIVFGRVVPRLMPTGEGIAGLQAMTTAGLVFHVLNIAAGVLAISVIVAVQRLGPSTQDRGPSTD